MQTITNIKQLYQFPFIARSQYYLPEEISTAFPVLDCAEPLTNLHLLFAKATIPVIFADPYANQQPIYLRSSAAKRLARAISYLWQTSQQQLTLKIYGGFRDLNTQRQLFDSIQAQIAAREHLRGQALWQRVTQFIADPDLTPPHCTGGAIDCTLYHVTDQHELDLGTPINTSSSRANTWHQPLPAAVKKNRQLLFTALTQTGFVNLASEWWHYSYGDQYWAIMRQKKYAIYGSLTLPPHLG